MWDSRNGPRTPLSWCRAPESIAPNDNRLSPAAPIAITAAKSASLCAAGHRAALRGLCELVRCLTGGSVLRRGWVVVAMVVAAAGSARATCAGDCNGDGVVTVPEVVTVDNIALGSLPLSACPAADANGDGSVGVGDAVLAVQAALDGCPEPPELCPTIPVATGSVATVLSGPGLLVQPGGAFAVATGGTVVTGTQLQAKGEVHVYRYSGGGALFGDTLLARRQQVILSPALTRLPNGGGMAAWGEANPRQLGARARHRQIES